MLYNWYQTTDEYVTDILERDRKFHMGDEQDFVYEYYRVAKELGVIDENPFEF